MKTTAASMEQKDTRPVIPLAKYTRIQLRAELTYVLALGWYLFCECSGQQSRLCGIILIVLALLAGICFVHECIVRGKYQQEPTDELVEENVNTARIGAGLCMAAAALLTALLWWIFGRGSVLQIGINSFLAGMLFLFELRQMFQNACFLLTERASDDTDEEE